MNIMPNISATYSNVVIPVQDLSQLKGLSSQTLCDMVDDLTEFEVLEHDSIYLVIIKNNLTGCVLEWYYNIEDIVRNHSGLSVEIVEKAKAFSGQVIHDVCMVLIKWE